MQNVDFGLYLKKYKVYLQLKIKDKILIYMQNLIFFFVVGLFLKWLKLSIKMKSWLALCIH